MSQDTHDTVRLNPNPYDDKEPTVSIGLATRRTEDCQPGSESLLWKWTYHRQLLLIGVILVAALSLCALLVSVIALKAHLNQVSTDLQLSESRVPTYESLIGNLTSTMDKDYKFNSSPSDSSVVYFRWGSPTCPATARRIYEGVTGTGSSILHGGGSNHLCMTTKPDYISPVDGRQGSRSFIFGAEYRSGSDFDPLFKLHGHDAPCAACLARRRSSVLMIPGSSKCPKNWTREYFGYLMATKKGFFRTTYICVDAKSESTIGSSDMYQEGGLLYPVEGYCNTRAGGGLPCGPYVDGHELTCAVCTL